MLNLFQSDDRQGPWHPREDDLLLYIDGELPARRQARIGAHLKACWACRAKVEKVESTITAFMDYRSRASARLGGITSDDAFRLRLRTLARQQGLKQSMRKSVARAWRLAGGANVRVPVMVAAGVLAVALLVLGWKYRQYQLHLGAGTVIAAPQSPGRTAALRSRRKHRSGTTGAGDPQPHHGVRP